MKSLNDTVAVYQNELRKGDILTAYNQLVQFLMSSRINFAKKLQHQYSVSKVQHGYLDYSYFYFTNNFVKSQKLKFGLVLNHLDMRFEVWLLGNTIPIQKEYWSLLRSTKWNEARAEMPKYSILEAVIVDKPNFNDLELLSQEVYEKARLVTDEIIDHLKDV